HCSSSASCLLSSPPQNPPPAPQRWPNSAEAEANPARVASALLRQHSQLLPEIHHPVHHLISHRRVRFVRDRVVNQRVRRNLSARATSRPFLPSSPKFPPPPSLPPLRQNNPPLNKPPRARLVASIRMRSHPTLNKSDQPPPLHALRHENRNRQIPLRLAFHFR